MTGTAKELVFALAKIADTDDTVYDLVEHKEKKTLSQNGYYWQLCGKVANKLRISTARLHNDMLAHYGQRFFIDGKCVFVTLPDTEESEEKAKENTTVHLMPSSKTIVGHDDVTYRIWAMLRGCGTYNTYEMSVLIDGLVQEAKQLGIETLTPNQLEEMRRLEQEAENRKK